MNIGIVCYASVGGSGVVAACHSAAAAPTTGPADSADASTESGEARPSRNRRRQHHTIRRGGGRREHLEVDVLHHVGELAQEGAGNGDPLALSATPYVYLIPVGVDAMRTPPLPTRPSVKPASRATEAVASPTA